MNRIRLVEYWGAVDGSAVGSGLCMHVLRCAFDSATHNSYWGRPSLVSYIRPMSRVGDYVGVESVIPGVY